MNPVEGHPYRRRFLNAWAIVAVFVFYAGFTSYSHGDVQVSVILVAVGFLLMYMGLAGGTKYEL